jgi:4-diphosphocytidyl-2-C-methyl-D-erythritol kinase
VTVVRLEAPAKVNLRLRIMAREDSGYHQLETVFAALDFGDVVEVTPAGAGVTLEVSGPSPCPPEDNLAYRAALAYMEAAGIAQGARIHLEKRIPAAGGLGGGSSDAAAVLRALDWMYEGELGVVRLARLGSDLGADVPFFLSPSPVALAWGRGDRFLPLPPLPEAYLLLCVPEVSVSTAAAFQAMTAARAAAGVPAPTGALHPEALESWSSMARLAQNDFHPAVFTMEPSLGELHTGLMETGPVICLLAGSGSTVFAVYEEPGQRELAEAHVAARLPAVELIRTTTRLAMPEPALRR